jgi:hypothetical protein
MGKLIMLPVKKTHTQPRRWSLPQFQQRAHQSQEAIQAAYAVLVNDYKLLKRKKRVNYQQLVKILQMVHALRQRTVTWSTTMYNDERLPFVVYIRRYPLLSACFHVQQHADKVITLLKKGCGAYSTSPIEEAQLYEDVVKTMAALLESGKEISSEITSLLDQIRFCEQQRRIV